MAHLDGELGGEERRAFRLHLEQCRRCRDRLEELEAHRAVFADAAARLDRPMPEIDNPAPGAGAGDGDAVAAFPPLRAAAAVLVLLLGGALLTPPGRALAERALGGIAGLFGGEPTATPVATAGRDTTLDRRATAVSASASDGRLEVSIVSPEGAEGVLRVSVGEERGAVVEGRIRDVERSRGRLRVHVDGLDGLRIGLPDSVGRAEVRVDGRSVLTQRGRRVLPAVPADTVDGDILVRPGP